MNTRPPLVLKASGEKQPFSAEKLEASLRRAQANQETIEFIVDEIQPFLYEGIKTREIYRKAFNLLRKHKRSMAARYGLKNAIMDLGPSGYPFEHFVGYIFKGLGYEVEVGQIMQGQCISHEVDVVAIKSTECNLVECKFANSAGKYSNVKVALYIRARMDDIFMRMKSESHKKYSDYKAWVVTNTRFTSDASDYGRCSGLNMLSWDSPKENSLKSMVERLKLFPITTLTTLYKKEKELLLMRNVVLCRQLHKDDDIINRLNLSQGRRKKLIKEVEELCG